ERGREAPGNEARAELTLRVNVVVEEIGIARPGRVVADRLRPAPHACWPRPWDDREQATDFTFFESIRRTADAVGEAARERQFVERMDPVGGVVELPVRVRIGLL